MLGEVTLGIRALGNPEDYFSIGPEFSSCLVNNYVRLSYIRPVVSMMLNWFTIFNLAINKYISFKFKFIYSKWRKLNTGILSSRAFYPRGIFGGILSSKQFFAGDFIRGGFYPSGDFIRGGFFPDTPESKPCCIKRNVANRQMLPSFPYG